MSESESDKSEPPTHFKLEQARRKGIVARGMDLGFLTCLCAVLLFVRITGPRFAASLSGTARAALVSGPQTADAEALFVVIAQLFAPAAEWLALLFGTMFASVLVLELVQTGAVFSGQPLKPDFSRLNPARGIKRLFSLRMLLEACKNLLKFASYVLVATLVIRSAERHDIGSVSDAFGLGRFMAATGGRLLSGFVFVAAIFATLDQLMIHRAFRRNMRMSRRDVRRELRDREGDPRLKQKRKQLHASFVKISQSMRNLPGADVVITNPQHLAIALRYAGPAMPAPQIVSIGANQIARRLKALATAYGIPMVENRPLAQALYRTGKLDGFVPEPQFGPVATIYNELRRAGLLKQERH